jgi:hypothetical protein
VSIREKGGDKMQSDNPDFKPHKKLEMPKYKTRKTIENTDRIPHLKNFLGNFLFRLGDCDTVYQNFMTEAQKCNPPLSEKELQEIYASARSWYNTEILPHPDYKKPQQVRATESSKTWQKPRPLGTFEPLPFPVDSFPSTLEWQIKAVAEFTETAPEMCGTLIIGALGGVFQGKYEVVSTAGNTETASTYTVAIGESAERKSAVVSKIIDPLLSFQKVYNMVKAPEISEDIAKKKALARNLTEAEKEGDVEKLVKAQQEYDKFSPRIPLSLLSQDATPEAITKDMKEQGERTIIASAEGGFFEKINGRYSPNGADHEVYLLAHAGDFISIKRVGRPPDELEHPAISIILTVQPCIIEEFTANPKFSGTGLSARFFYGVCEEKAGRGRHPVREKSMDYFNAVFESYNKIIKKILEKTVNVKERKEVKLSQDAHDFACTYFYVTENWIETEGAEMKAWNGKAFGGFVKIAGLFHCFECFEKDIKPEDYSISLQNAQRAAAVMDCFHSHAQKVFSATDKLLSNAIYVLKRINTEVKKRQTSGETDGNTSFSKREIARLTHGYSAFKGKDGGAMLDEALALLVDYGYISTNFLPTGGRPSEQIEVNPFLN